MADKIDINSNDQIDIIQIIKVLWRERLLFYITMTISVLLGIIIAFSIPKSFTSEAKLAPEFNNGTPSNSNISDIASMVGIDVNSSGGSADAIYPDIYPDIIKSTPFVTDLFNVKISSNDNSFKNITYYEYLEKHQNAPWWDKLIGGIQKTFSKKKACSNGSLRVNNFKLTQDQNDILNIISNSINCSVDKKNSIITIDVTAQDPLVAAILADTIQSRLQEYITDYRTRKAKNDLAYTMKLIREAKGRYTKSQKKYASYSDANEDVILESVKSKQDEMENDMQLNYNTYNQLAQQLQAAQAKVQETTPAFTQIQPATVPLKKAGPKRMTIILICMFLGFTCTSIFILIRDAQTEHKK